MQKAVNNVQTLYRRWQELLDNPRTVGKDEYNWTTNELRNNLRSIEWDLEDLDETVGIVEANPRKFNIDITEVNQRKQFIKQTRDNVNSIKEHMNSPAAKAKVENSSRDVRCLFVFLFMIIMHQTIFAYLSNFTFLQQKIIFCKWNIVLTVVCGIKKSMSLSWSYRFWVNFESSSSWVWESWMIISCDLNPLWQMIV